MKLQIENIAFEERPSGSSFFLWRNAEQALSPPSPRQTVINRQQQDGALSSSQFYGAREIPMAIEIVGSPSAVQAKKDLLKSKLKLGLHTATLDDTRTIEVYVSQSPQFTASNDERILLCEFTLRSDDPFFYGEATTESGAEKAVTSTYTIQDGALPTINTKIQETVLPSVIVTTTTDTPPTFTVTGATEDPIIRNNDTEEEIKFTGLTVGADDTLVVDCRLRTAKLNGVDVSGKLTIDSVWFNLTAGDNSIALYDREQPLTGNLSISYRERYL